MLSMLAAARPAFDSYHLPLAAGGLESAASVTSSCGAAGSVISGLYDRRGFAANFRKRLT
jgi:hypothetical protein